MSHKESAEPLVLPKNIRQIGNFGDTYKIYVEDFVYTYVHQLLHRKKEENCIAAAVLLGKTICREGKEYIFISGAHHVRFEHEERKNRAGESGTAGHGTSGYSTSGVRGQAYESSGYSASDPRAQAYESSGYSASGSRGQVYETAEYETPEYSSIEYGIPENRSTDNRAGNGKAPEFHGQSENSRYQKDTCSRGPMDMSDRQQEFWNEVYRGIKEHFPDAEILGWYFDLAGTGLEVTPQLQQFFEITHSRGSRFLYYEDSLEKTDAFFVQEQHKLQRISGYAVYYERNPLMQEYMIREKERIEPETITVEPPLRKNPDTAQNYQAIMKKLNEKPKKKKQNPFLYAAGIFVLLIVAATGITQLGNYQNLKYLQSTLQTLSGAVDATKTTELSEEAREIVSKADNGDTVANQSEGGETTPNNTSGTGKTGESTGDTDTSQNRDDEATGNSTLVTEGSGGTSGSTTTDQSGSDGTSGSNISSMNGGSGDTQAVQNYTVRKGDSLVSISQKFYHTINMVDKICELNNIENVDQIYIGQVLRLP